LVEVRGVKQAVEGVGEAAESIVSDLEKVLGRAAAYTALRARAYAPERTGRLRRSIESRRVGRLTYSVTASAPYAGYVEFGTSRSPPRRFMQRAVAEAVNAFLTSTTKPSRL